MTALMIILISGIFLNTSWVLEQMYHTSQVDNFLLESYKFMRVLALMILFVGVYFYIKKPLPYIFDYYTKSFFITYHVLICLGFLYLGALLFQKLMETLK